MGLGDVYKRQHVVGRTPGGPPGHPPHIGPGPGRDGGKRGPGGLFVGKLGQLSTHGSDRVVHRCLGHRFVAAQGQKQCIAVFKISIAYSMAPAGGFWPHARQRGRLGPGAAQTGKKEYPLDCKTCCNPLVVFRILSSCLLVVAVTMDKVETVFMTTSPPLISEIVAFGRLRDGSGV